MATRTTSETARAAQAEAQKWLAIAEGRGKPTRPRAAEKPGAAAKFTKQLGRAEAEMLAAVAVVAASGVKSWTEALSKFKILFGKKTTTRRECDPLKGGETWEIVETIYPAKQLADCAVAAGVVAEDGVPVGPVVESRKRIF